MAWLQSQDLEYHNGDREGGLYYLLESEGQTVRLVEDAEIAEAMGKPPEGTRAYFRGRSLEKFGDQVESINWDRIVFGVPHTELEAKFSMPYLIARALVDGRVGLDAFTDDADLDAKVARYRHQGAAYALAPGRATGRPVHPTVFCFVRAPYRTPAVARPTADPPPPLVFYVPNPPPLLFGPVLREPTKPYKHRGGGGSL